MRTRFQFHVALENRYLAGRLFDQSCEMTDKVDVVDDGVLRWSLTSDGVDIERDTEYPPTITARAREGNLGQFDAPEDIVEADPTVVGVDRERWFTCLATDERERI